MSRNGGQVVITIVDYGMGNLRSVEKAFAHTGFPTVVTDDPKKIREADAVVLPGVGAFAMAMEHLQVTGLDGIVLEAIKAGKPFLGICLGMQLLFDSGEETFDGSEAVSGLGVISGKVRRFPADLKVPQIGWNQLAYPKYSENSRIPPLYAGVPEGSYVYFVHSYYVDPEDPKVAASTTHYGIDFVSSIARDNVWAIQFHPEKSSKIGLRILRNFGEWAAKCR